MTLTIIKKPVVFAGTDATINEGETHILNEATALEYTSLEWSSTGTGSFDNPGTLNPEYTPGTGETGIISLILTGYGNNPCAEQKDTMDLEIVPYAGFAVIGAVLAGYIHRHLGHRGEAFILGALGVIVTGIAFLFILFGKRAEYP